MLTKIIESLERFFGAAMKIVDPVFEFISTLPGWLGPVVLLAPAAVFGTIYLRWWFGRRARWEQAAVLLGFTPLDEKASLTARFPHLSEFAGTTKEDAETLWGCRGSRSGQEVWLADYNRRIGGKTRGRTVAVLRTSGADWPHLILREVRGAAQAGSAGEGLPDAEFDRIFRVEGQDADATRSVLTPAARAGLVRLSATCRELNRKADTFSVRLVLRASNQVGSLNVETAGDAFAVCAHRWLDPAVVRDLLDAAETACASLGH